MAKKTNGLKIVGIALLAIIGLGSLSALARNKDKDEDNHVHDFTTSKICSCGEGHTIAFTDIEAGMDLSGYALRLTISEEEFEERFSVLVYPDDPGGGYCIDGFNELNNYQVTFEQGENLFFNIDYGFSIIDFTSGSMNEKYFINVSYNDGSVTVDENIVLDEKFSCVKSIDGKKVEALDYIELYYVGLEKTAATSSTFSMNRGEQETDALNGGEIVATCRDEGFWTPIF